MTFSTKLFLPMLCLAILIAGPGYGQGKKKKQETSPLPKARKPPGRWMKSAEKPVNLFLLKA